MELNVKNRIRKIRVRTWTLTLSIVVAIAFYFAIQMVFAKSIDWINLVFVSLLQVIVHCIYFPDGELYGTSGEAYVNNRKSYNIKATRVNDEHKIYALREYCKVDFEDRKREWISNECGAIGITTDELNQLKEIITIKEIKKSKRLEINGKFVFLTKESKSRLIDLLHNKIPIKPNLPETILSAMENNHSQNIEDESKKFKEKSYIGRILRAFLVGLFFAWISFEARDGITISTIVQIIYYLCTIFTTAVMSYSKGETCTKVYRNKFYIDLINFLDAFFEWNESKI